MIGAEPQLALFPVTELTWRLSLVYSSFSCEGASAERGRKQNQETSAS